MHTKLTIPERLKDLRVSEKKMSLQELSDATGIPCSTLGNYERYENVDMSLSSLLTLADFYHVSTDYLLCRTELVIKLFLRRQCTLSGTHKILPAVAGLNLARSSKGVYVNLLKFLVLQCNQV